jgi:ribulose-5-phosphate 4-epimerase/fuculose-1-phosphate aldolase
MASEAQIRSLWFQTRERLMDKGLLSGPAAALSLRCPGDSVLWLGAAGDVSPSRIDWLRAPTRDAAAIHARVYAQRGDVGAIACGGGPFAACLADFGGQLPQVFDEQARHIGPMARPVSDDKDLGAALDKRGNAQYLHDLLLCFGTTATRLALNLELFEKCAKAYVLAVAAGGRPRALPWWVRRIANSRLAKDQALAAAAYDGGELPPESRGY